MIEERWALAELPEKAGEGDFLRAVAEAVPSTTARPMCCPISISPSPTAANCTAGMRWTSEFSADVVVCRGAGDLVTKSEVLAGSLAGPPDHLCLAGLRRPRTPRRGPRGRHWPTNCS